MQTAVFNLKLQSPGNQVPGVMGDFRDPDTGANGYFSIGFTDNGERCTHYSAFYSTRYGQRFVSSMTRRAQIIAQAQRHYTANMKPPEEQDYEN